LVVSSLGVDSKRRESPVGVEGLAVLVDSKDLDEPAEDSVILREASEEIRFKGSLEVNPEVRDLEDDESVAANGLSLSFSKLLRAVSDG